MLKDKSFRSTLAATLVLGLSLPLLAQVPPATPPAAAPADPNKVIITVGDQKVTVQEFNDLVADLPPEAQAMAHGPGKRMLGEKLAEVKLLAGEAQRRKLDQSPKFQRQMELIRQQLLASALANDVKSNIDDAAIKKYYDEHKGDFDSVKARHILVRSGTTMPGEPQDTKVLTDEQAKAKIDKIRERLVKGEDFAAVAKAESDDKGSAAQGGELGSFRRNQMVKPFEDTAFSLKEGELSLPVKTQFGYHLIQVQEKTSASLDSSKKEIEARLTPDRMEQMVGELKKNNPAKLDESFFGPARPMMMPGQP